jgi:hypothetical protein
VSVELLEPIVSVELLEPIVSVELPLMVECAFHLQHRDSM